MKLASALLPAALRDPLPQVFRRTDQAEQQMSHGVVRNDVGRAAAFNQPDVQCARTGLGIGGQLQFADLVQRVEQLLDCGFTELGIGRVRHLAARDQLDTQRPLRRDGQAVLGRLAVDQELHAARLLVRNLSTLTVALLAHQKQQANVNALGLQLLGGCDLSHDDALGVAGAAAVDAICRFRRRNERRDRIHVGGQRKLRIRMIRVRRPDIEAIAFDGNSFDVVAELGQFTGERVADRAFHTGRRFDIDELASKCENVHLGRIDDFSRRDTERLELSGGPV